MMLLLGIYASIVTSMVIYVAKNYMAFRRRSKNASFASKRPKATQSITAIKAPSQQVDVAFHAPSQASVDERCWVNIEVALNRQNMADKHRTKQARLREAARKGTRTLIALKRKRF